MNDIVEGVRYLVNREAQLEQELSCIRAALEPIRTTVASMGRPRHVAPIEYDTAILEKRPPRLTKVDQLRAWIDARETPFRAGDIEIDGIPRTQMASYVATARRMGYCERVAVGLYRRPTERANKKAA